MAKSIASSPLQDAVKRLIEKEPKWKAFDPAPPKGAKPGSVAVGRPSATQSSAGGGVGDLNEPDYELREWWPEYNVETTDGLFVIVWQDVKKIVLDNGGSTINLTLDERPAPAP